MRYHLLTLALLAVAAVLWYLGMHDKLALLVIPAALTELVAWTRMFKRRNRS